MEQTQSTSLLQRIFGPKDNAASKSNSRMLFKPAGANSGIRDGKNHIKFDRDLVGFLKEDHRRLMAKFLEVETNVRAREYSLAESNAEEFLLLLRGHVYEENIKIYTLLAASDVENSAETKQLQVDMRKIHIALKKCIEDMLDAGLSDLNSSAFLDNWAGKGGKSSNAAVGYAKSFKAILVDRIQKEEQKLYPRYDSLASK